MTIFVYLVLCLIWGSTWMAIKLGLADAPPLWSAAIRFLIAVAILLVVAKVRGLKLPSKPRDWFVHAGPGVLMYGLSYASVYTAEQYISTSLTAVLFACFPVFVALLSHVMLPHDRLRRVAWPGMALGLAGVLVISWHTLQISGALLAGSMLAVFASFVSALGVVLHKRYCMKTDIVVAAATQMMFGVFVLLSGALLFESYGDLVWSPASVGSIIYLSILGTVVAFLGYYWLMTHISVVAAAMIAFVTPLVASVIGTVFFDESFALPTAIGGAMVLAAVVIVSYARRQSAEPPPIID